MCYISAIYKAIIFKFNNLIQNDLFKLTNFNIFHRNNNIILEFYFSIYNKHILFYDLHNKDNKISIYNLSVWKNLKVLSNNYKQIYFFGNGKNDLSIFDKQTIDKRLICFCPYNSNAILLEISEANRIISKQKNMIDGIFYILKEQINNKKKL